ncbi:MAG: hypothetical protein ACD_5C00354G0005 [uncultured bacterium]|nr:MAG: hypothetical protein ACD_5C00354G0005 [uncultured bacterium]
MDKTRKIIDDNKDAFPEFQYYHNILDKIEENIEKMPDIAIESCKSLFEGTSKTILKFLGENYQENGRNPDSSDNLVKKAINELSKYTSEFDPVFVQAACGFVKRMSEIRNERGDISHGKSVPKNKNSDHNLSEMVSNVTDCTLSYILNVFFKSAIPNFEENNYDKYSDFNEFLDNENEIGISYSKALFDQDIVAYRERLNNYLSEKEI